MLPCAFCQRHGDRAGGSNVVMPEGSRRKATAGLCFPSRTSELIVRVFLPGLPFCCESVKRMSGRRSKHGVTRAGGARCGNSRGQRPCLTECSSQGTCARGHCPATVYCRSAIRRNAGGNTLPSGHVQRAAYFHPYFYRIALSPGLCRPLCGEPLGGRLAASGHIVERAYGRQ